MSTEAAMWSLVRNSKLPGSWHRVENRVEPGMPDLHYAWKDKDGIFRTGWIELKTVAITARQAARPLLINHFRKMQRFWLRAYSSSGGSAAFLLRVDSGHHEYFLLPGKWAADHVGLDATLRDMNANAAAYWIGPWSREIFLQGVVRIHDHLRGY